MPGEMVKIFVVSGIVQVTLLGRPSIGFGRCNCIMNLQLIKIGFLPKIVDDNTFCSVLRMVYTNLHWPGRLYSGLVLPLDPKLGLASNSSF